MCNLGWQTRLMKRSRQPRLAKRAAADALMLVACRVAGGSTWRFYKRLMLAACVAGVGYGYLVSLDERRRRGAGT